MKNKLEKLMYMGIGAAIALLSFSLGTMHRNTADAQGEVPIVDLIRCRRLEVVNPFGGNEVVLTTGAHGGAVIVIGKDDKKSIASLSIDARGGEVRVFGEERSASLSIDAHGGRVKAFGEEGMASLHIDENGGNVLVFGRDGKKRRITGYK